MSQARGQHAGRRDDRQYQLFDAMTKEQGIAREKNDCRVLPN
jgi:hypothetical protein